MIQKAMARRTLETLSFDNTYARLPSVFYSRVNPTPFSASPYLVHANPVAAELIDLDPEQFTRPEFSGLFWRERVSARYGAPGHAVLRASVRGLCPAAR